MSDRINLTAEILFPSMILSFWAFDKGPAEGTRNIFVAAEDRFYSIFTAVVHSNT